MKFPNAYLEFVSSKIETADSKPHRENNIYI